MSTTVTVPGAQNTTISETYADGSNGLAVANQIAISLAAAKTAGILTVSDWQSLVLVPTGNIGEIAVTTAGGANVNGSEEGYTYVAIDQSVMGAVTVSGAANLFAGNQDIVYNPASGSGTIGLALGDGNNSINLPTGTTYNVGFGNGSDTVVADGTGTINGGTGNNLYTSNGDNVLNTNGQDTIIAGAGSTTVNAFSGDQTIFGGSGSLVYNGFPGDDPTFIGGNGNATVFGGDGQNITYFDGTGVQQGANILVASFGSETINAGGSSAGVQMAVGNGEDVLTGSTGNDIFYAGDGNATITGNGGADAYIFSDSGGGGAMTITDWTSQDNFVVVGFDGNAAQEAIANGSVSGGSFVASLPDGTVITFQNVTDPTQIHNQSFPSPTPV